MAQPEKVREHYGAASDLERGEVVVGQFSVCEDGALGIYLDRGFTERLNAEQCDQIVAIVRSYLNDELRRNQGG